MATARSQVQEYSQKESEDAQHTSSLLSNRIEAHGATPKAADGTTVSLLSGSAERVLRVHVSVADGGPRLSAGGTTAVRSSEATMRLC